MSDFDEELLSEFIPNSSVDEFVVEEPLPPPVEDLPPVEESTTIGDGQCVVCGAPVWRPAGKTPTGRQKRVPKYCDVHNPKNRVVDSSDYPTGNLETQLRKIQNDLADDLALLGTLAGPLFPVTGYYIVDNADAFTTALLQLCKNNPRALKAAHRLGQLAPVYRCARFGAGVGIAAQVDQKKHDPHSTTAQRLGVTRAYDAVYSNTNTYPSDMDSFGFSGPPRYATVQ